MGFGTGLYFSLLAVRFLDILRHGDVRRGPHLLFDERFQRVYERVNVSFVEQALRRGPNPGPSRLVWEPLVRRRRQSDHGFEHIVGLDLRACRIGVYPPVNLFGYRVPEHQPRVLALREHEPVRRGANQGAPAHAVERFDFDDQAV